MQRTGTSLSLVWAGLLALTLGGCALAPSEAPPLTPPTAVLKAIDWSAIDGWRENDAAGAWQAFLASCTTLRKQNAWRPICDAATNQPPADDASARAFFEQWFTPYQLTTSAGGEAGLVTGYYEPLLHGSRSRSERFRYPVYAVPDDMLTIDLTSVYPDLKQYRLRGRLQGKRVVPYYSRAEIDNGAAPLSGKELFWVDDAVDLFFLQIQGSGRIQLENGETARVGYADQNGHPYVSIGKKLVERGELTPDQASMQGIKRWGEAHPDQLPELLDTNASYVFFRELPVPPASGPNGPLGALGVPLSGGRSLAVDPRAVPLGVPVFLSTTMPNDGAPLQRLMLAQDTGGAIKGVVRADFFWGFGAEAGKQAGAMRQQGRMWVLLPRNGIGPASTAQ
jgi:membrane-bound lytic murein transglycosylase A